MSVTRVLPLLCFVIGLHVAHAAGGIASSIRQADRSLSIVVNDFVLKGQTKGASCPPRINIKAVRAIGGTSFENAVAINDPGASRLPLDQFFAVIRVKDVVVGGAQCTGASETVLIAPASLPKLVSLLQAAPPSPSGRLAVYGNLIRAMAKHANDSTKAVGTLLLEKNKPVKCGKYPYPGFVFFLTDIAKDAKQLAARLNLKAADQKKKSLQLITSPSTPLTTGDLRAFDNGTLPMCAYGISGKSGAKSAASATSGTSSSAGKGVSASADASTETGPNATATTSGVSPPDATSSTSTSGTGASASAGTGPKATATTSGAQPPGNGDSGGSAFSSSESTVDGSGSVSCKKSTSHQGSGSSSASCR
jgi:hypothetical protein